MTDLVRCDGCRELTRTEPGYPYTLNKGDLWNRLGEGPWHFCSIACLIRWAEGEQ